MICPFLEGTTTVIQTWKQTPTEEGTQLKNGITATQTIITPPKCKMENCAAWQNGKCSYKR